MTKMKKYSNEFGIWHPTPHLATFPAGSRGNVIKQWWHRSDGYGEWRPLPHHEDYYWQPDPRVPLYREGSLECTDEDNAERARRS
jgi:hypothetical protein